MRNLFILFLLIWSIEGEGEIGVVQYSQVTFVQACKKCKFYFGDRIDVIQGINHKVL